MTPTLARSPADVVKAANKNAVKTIRISCAVFPLISLGFPAAILPFIHPGTFLHDYANLAY